MTGEGLFAPRFESLFPVANEIVVEAEAACGLGDGVALLGDELDGLRFEFRGVGASRSCHVGPPKSEFTLLSGCPPFVGRSRLFLLDRGWLIDFGEGQGAFKYRTPDGTTLHGWQCYKSQPCLASCEVIATAGCQTCRQSSGWPDKPFNSLSASGWLPAMAGRLCVESCFTRMVQTRNSGNMQIIST